MKCHDINSETNQFGLVISQLIFHPTIPPCSQIDYIQVQKFVYNKEGKINHPTCFAPGLLIFGQFCSYPTYIAPIPPIQLPSHLYRTQYFSTCDFGCAICKCNCIASSSSLDLSQWIVISHQISGSMVLNHRPLLKCSARCGVVTFLKHRSFYPIMIR